MLTLLRLLFRWTGGSLILLAAIILGADLNEATHQGTFQMATAGDLWARVDAHSLAAAMTALHNWAGPEISDWAARTLLGGAAFYVAVLGGLVCLLISWVPRPKNDERMSALHREMNLS